MKPRKDSFTPPTKTRDGDTVFTKAEQKAVIALAEDDAMKHINALPLGIVLLFNLGIRDGELCALKWNDIEVDSRKDYIHIQREMVPDIDDNGKSHGVIILEHCKSEAGDRRLQLNDKAKETLSQIKQINESNGIPVGPDDYILMKIYRGEISNCTSRSIDSRLRKYCRQANMSVIKSPHDIRRTVLTNLYTHRMPLKKIQEYAGHSSLKQTMDYLRIPDEDIDLLQYLNALSDDTDTDNIVLFEDHKSKSTQVNTDLTQSKEPKTCINAKF